ncbi:PCYCGC domain-containing protein [Paenibacillus pasadenensis]|uniref:PCYCGC domain-containing protein n=1 Tax=Paenibacillus pasadenensis TaxID=217090 RepID=UPI00203CB604|nr:PCYCGC domain-containing protein [Paenibacillus pasadenensis]MCM3750244.1 PCYCGC domain-containing protein [Paenibacillus pasadenensis]
MFHSKSPWRRTLRRLLPVVSISFALLLAACGDGGSVATEGSSSHADSGSQDGHGDHAATDIREETASASQLPKFLDTQPEQIQIVYTATATATDLLSKMPCYCGCMENVGHKSNLNCFINEVREDGSIVWDDHATRCGVCLQIAAESISMKVEGKTDEDIRKTIEEMYGRS